MNRFKTKKKAAKEPKEEVSDVRPSLESESSFSLFRRGKKTHEPETKKELDLASALPSNDDFRTSLLMSGLSARFSMLREQDDPYSKIGKASDDSVLFPKRQSRLADFGFGNGSGLGDIAEVESLKAPTFLRKDSDTSNDSSVMTRSRPMESNVLFGGRQKIYKVATSKNASDGLGGRVLYDSNAGCSSFQKWRLTEKEKKVGTLDQPEDHQDDQAPSDRGPEESSFLTGSESPVPDYNQKRETFSTTSSAPSVGRNSTAATSIISQPTTVSKEAGQSANPTPGLERHVTRTRKLYEQGLTQNLQEQQYSVLSRVDTLARRPGGGRTPEMSPNTPSPTTQTFNDRWAAVGGERRIILNKGSAPNLRSMSPPATGSLHSTMTLDTSAASASNAKGGLVMSPPLSPPISDAGTSEHVNLDIQARDLGKATAMNVFQKPTSPYDDSKYAERMRQLQLGRATPTQRFRDDANPTVTDNTAPSAASTLSEEAAIKTTSLSAPKIANSPVQDSAHGPIFLDGTLESPILNEHVHSPQTPELRLERPSDHEHPAFRGAIAPRPLNFPTSSEPQSPCPATPDLSSDGPQSAMLSDSPTLGPTTGGLSGMVRQHLRTESDVSSIYGQSPQPSPGANVSKTAQEDLDSIESQINDAGPSPQISKRPMPRMRGDFMESQRSPDEEAEFAGQLADARRRVREKLTSFVETDAAHFSSPLLADQATELPPLPNLSNPLGILRGKSSRGSLVDRGRDAVRTNREPGTVDATESRSNEEEDAHPSHRPSRQVRREMPKRKEAETGVTSSPTSPYERSHMTSPRGAVGEQMHMAHDGRREISRVPNGSRLPHSGPRQPRPMAGAIPEGISSAPPSARSWTARDRSGSEHSDGSSRSRSRPPPRSSDQVHANDGQLLPSEMLSGQTPRRPMMRSPGLPGTDIRGSPIVPPVNPRNGLRPAAPGSYKGSYNDPANQKSVPGRAMTEPMSSVPFPGAARNGRFEQPRSIYPPNSSPDSAPGSGPTTPTLPPSRRPSIASNAYASTNASTLTDAMKRTINKKDISEPTFVMSTSRVPTTNLPQDHRGTRSRNGSIADHVAPPPLPPVNPRRVRDNSKTRTMMNGIMGGRRIDESEMAAFSKSTPQLALASPPVPPFANVGDDERTNAFSAADEDARPARLRLRKTSSELGMDMRAGENPKRVSPPRVAVGPPGNRARGGPPPNMNGGMF
ncbi:unnamed protein product [Discula destructiva]